MNRRNILRISVMIVAGIGILIGVYFLIVCIHSLWFSAVHRAFDEGPRNPPPVEDLRGPDCPESFQMIPNTNAIVVRDNSRTIWLIELEPGKTPRQLDLVDEAPLHNSLMLSVNPDGSHLAYLSNFDSGEPHKFRPWIVELSQDGEPYRLEAPEPEDDKYSTDYLPVWSPQGDRIAFFADGTLHVASVDSFPPNFNDLMNQERSSEIASCIGGCRNIAWSPDGRHIAFTGSDPHMGRGRLFIADSYEGSSWDPSIFDGSMPTWSPDSKTLAFSGEFMASDKAAIYTVDADGSNLRTIYVFKHDFWQSSCGTSTLWLSSPTNVLSWSPDGSKLLFALNPSDGGLHFVDLSIVSAPRHRVVGSEHLFGVGYADWTPDGSRVLVYARDSGTHLYTIAPDGSDVRWLMGGG